MAIRSSSTNAQIPKREPCIVCNLPVFLVERVVVGKHLYHSSCFRCARCGNQLSAGNYYETEVKDQFCCEVCPNEEDVVGVDNAADRIVPKSHLARSLSDEEKASSKLYGDSAPFLTALDITNECDSSVFLPARSQFMQELITCDDTPPELPKTKPPDDVVVAADFAQDLSDNCVPDSLKFSVNSSDEVIAERTAIDVITKENNTTDSNKSATIGAADDCNKEEEDVIALIPDKSVILISDESAITISDDSIIMCEEKGNDSLSNDKNQLANDDIHTETIDQVTKDCKTEEIQPSTRETTCKSLNPFSDDEDEPPAREETLKRTLPEKTNIATGNDLTQTKEEYASSLNPFSSDDDDEATTANSSKVTRANDSSTKLKEDKSLNPFSSDEDDQEEVLKTPPPRPKKRTTNSSQPGLRKVSPFPFDFKVTSGSTGDTPENLKVCYPQRISVGPTYTQTGQTIPAITKTNPFSSDEDDESTLKIVTSPNLFPGSMNGTFQRLSDTSFGGSSLSLASTASSSVPSTLRKKKPAPKPPVSISSTHSSPQTSITSSPSTSAQHSPKPRKAKRAPLPPTSTPKNAQSTTPALKASFSPVTSPLDFEAEKVAKDEANRQTQTSFTRDKSTYGKWKRKKGQAPALPVPQKRTIKELPNSELKKELDIIDVQLQGLMKQGVHLEKIIRNLCEGPEANPDATRNPIEAEDLILQLFEVVNERNELCRRQGELMYLRRQHRLEEEQAMIDYQLRCLMQQNCKTDSDKARETELIKRLVEVVNLRAEIVDTLEIDRVRCIEEDDSITTSMNAYANRRKEAIAQKSNDPEQTTPKKEKKKFHKKLLKFKRFAKADADKDVDESESNHSNSSKGKKKK